MKEISIKDAYIRIEAMFIYKKGNGNSKHEDIYGKDICINCAKTLTLSQILNGFDS